MSMSSPTATDRPAAMGGAPAFPEGLRFVNPRVPDASLVTKDVEAILRAVSSRTVRSCRVRGCGRGLPRRASLRRGLLVHLRADAGAPGVRALGRRDRAVVHVRRDRARGRVERPAARVRRHRPTHADAVARRGAALGRACTRRRSWPRTSTARPCDVEGARRHGPGATASACSSTRPTRSGRCTAARQGRRLRRRRGVQPVADEGGGGRPREGSIATNDDLLAERCRIGRDYGNPGDYDCRFVGLNARMSEFHAAVRARVARGPRRAARPSGTGSAAAYTDGAREASPASRFPEVPTGDRSTYKDFTILVDADGFGVDADRLATMLAARASRPGATTRRRCTSSARTCTSACPPTACR